MTDLVRREAEFFLYQTDDGRPRVEVRFADETAWLSLGQMADLFQRDKSVISRHIKNVFDEGELSPEATVAKSATVQRERAVLPAPVDKHFELAIRDVKQLEKARRGAKPEKPVKKGGKKS